jgi:hypothetical protein
MNATVNIFLDSTALYTDPVFKSSFSQLLLKLSKAKKIKIYISKVVLSESLNNYEKQLKEIYLKTSKEIENLDSITFEKNENQLIKLQNHIDKYNLFFEEKIKSKEFTIIDYVEDILPQLIQRSIKRIKPFTEARQEFRDAIIWLSYVSYIKSNKLSNNHFITNNKRDFWDNNSTGLHPELRKEILDLTVYSNFQEICTKENTILNILKEREFTEWLSGQNILDSDILSLIQVKLWTKIVSQINSKIDKLKPHLYFQDIKASYFEFSYQPDNLILGHFSMQQISNFAFIECDLLLEGLAIIYPIEYAWAKEKRPIVFKIKMSFAFDIKSNISDFNISEIQINPIQ